mgnify:FL=1
MHIKTKIINGNIIDVVINDDKSNTELDFENFSNIWKQFYLDKKYFIFKIDTSNLTNSSIYYCYKMAMLIRSFKNCKIQYLKYTIMTIPSGIIRNLLNIIMKIEKPIATIYVTKNIQESNNLYNYKLDNSVLLETFILVNNVNVIEC